MTVAATAVATASGPPGDSAGTVLWWAHGEADPLGHRHQ